MFTAIGKNPYKDTKLTLTTLFVEAFSFCANRINKFIITKVFCCKKCKDISPINPKIKEFYFRWLKEPDKDNTYTALFISLVAEHEKSLNKIHINFLKEQWTRFSLIEQNYIIKQIPTSSFIKTLARTNK